MSLKKSLALVCLFVFANILIPSAHAFNDGGLDDTSSLAAPSGNRSTLKKKHLRVEQSSGYSKDDYNFFGIQGSLGLANQSGGGTGMDSGNRIGMMAGAYYERRFIPYLGMRAGMDFNMRGFSTTDQAQGVSNSFAINYLEFPLLVKAQIPTNVVTPYIAVGPFLGLAVGKSFSQQAINGGPSQDVQGFDTLINGVNFGLEFGGGLDFEVIRHLNLEVGARYSLGLTNVLTAQGQQFFGGQAAQQGFQAAPTNVSIQLNDIQIMSGLSYSL